MPKAAPHFLKSASRGFRGVRAVLKRLDHFITRKNRYFPGFLRKGLSRLVFTTVDRRLKARYPDYETAIFAKLPPIAGQWPGPHDGYQLFAVGDAAYMSRYA